MAISNSEGKYPVLFFNRLTGSDSEYNSMPASFISQLFDLEFAHDLKFSPDEKGLVIVAREAQQLAYFTKINRGFFSSWKPLWSIAGGASWLHDPTSVDFTSSGEWMVIANRWAGLSLLHKSATSGYELTQTISLSQLLFKTSFAEPHGVAFDSENYLFVVHKPYYKNEETKGSMGISVFGWNEEGTALDVNPLVVFPLEISLHSIDFHPGGVFFAITSEFGSIHLLSWSSTDKTIIHEQSVSLEVSKKDFQGPKGIAFTQDGKKLAVTSTLNQILFFELLDQ